eukprot:COSAG05_NODE_2586_length_2871_cov_21.775758_4_plen_95_part_00
MSYVFFYPHAHIGFASFVIWCCKTQEEILAGGLDGTVRVFEAPPTTAVETIHARRPRLTLSEAVRQSFSFLHSTPAVAIATQCAHMHACCWDYL